MLRNFLTAVRLNASLLAWALGCLLWALAILLPFQAGAWAGFYKQMLAVAGLGCWLLAVLPKRWHGFSLCMLSLMLVVGAQYAAGLINFHDDAVLSVAYLFMLLVSFEIGATLRETQNEKEGKGKGEIYFVIFLWFLIFVCLFSALIACHQWLGNVQPTFEFPLVGERPYANLAQPNHLATLLVMGCGGVLFLHQKCHLSGWLGSIVTCFFLVAVALTISRAAWLFVGVALIYLLWKIRCRELELPRWAPWFFSVFFLLCVLLVASLSQQLGLDQLPLAERLDGGNMNRLRLWSGLLIAVQAGPWYGHGWMQVVPATLVSPAPIFGEYINFSHSLPIDLLVWMGPWLGGLVILSAVIFLWRHFFKPQVAGDVAIWLVLGMLTLSSLLEFPYAYTFLLIPGGVMLGWVTTGAKCGHQAPAPPWGKAVSVVCVVLLFLGASTVTREYAWLVQSDFHDRMQRAHITGFPVMDLDRVAWLDSLRSWQQVKRLPETGKLNDAQMQLLERVTSRIPAWSNLVRLERAYIAREDKAGTCKVIDAIAKINGPLATREARKIGADLIGSGSCKETVEAVAAERRGKYPLVF